MDVQIIVEGDVGVEGGVHPARHQHLDGLVQGVDAQDLGPVGLRQGHIGAGDAVGGGLARQILEGGDVGVVRPDRQGGVDVAVGDGEVVGQGPLLGQLHAVADHVIPARIQTGEEAVPGALHKLGLDPQLFGQGGGDLYVVAHQFVRLVVVGPGRPGAFGGHHQGAPGLDGLQQVHGGRPGGAGSAGCGAVGSRAAAQLDNPCRAQNGQQGDKGSSFHGKISFLWFNRQRGRRFLPGG